MTKTSNDRSSAKDQPRGPLSADDLALERALEGLFRLTANRRFDARQAQKVGAVVTRAGYATLRSISDRDTLTLRQVAEASAMDTATASRQVMQLVEEGLVHRAIAEDDGRSVELTLTDHGRQVYERIVRYRLAHLDRVLQTWPDADRATLTVLVTRLAADLAGEGAPPPPSA